MGKIYYLRYLFLNLLTKHILCRYTEVINITGAGQNHILQSIIESDAELSVPLPDYSQMIPYKPKSNPLPGEHPVPG